MSDRPVRVGLIGFGYAGRTFHAPLIGATEGIELAAIASSQRDAIADQLGPVPVVGSVADLLVRQDVDLVVVASPNHSHASIACQALEAGKHVVVEKPYALTLDEARGVNERARRSGRLFAVFQNRRWDSDFLAVRTAIERGSIGRAVHFESHFDRFRPQVRDRWRERPEDGGGIWYDLAPHLVDQALQLFGLPERVEASLAILRPGASAHDWAHAILHYPEKRVILHASMLAAGGSARFIVHGTLGSLVKERADQQEAQLLAGVVPGSPGWGRDEDPLVRYDEGGRTELPAPAGDQRAFYRIVVAAIRDGAKSPVPLAQALATTAVIEAALRSSSEQRAMPLSLTRAEQVAFAED